MGEEGKGCGGAFVGGDENAGGEVLDECVKGGDEGCWGGDGEEREGEVCGEEAGGEGFG